MSAHPLYINLGESQAHRTTPGLFVLLVPGIEGLLSIRLVLEDAQQVAVAKGIDGLLG